MNRRGFMGLLGKLLSVGTAMGIAPEFLKPFHLEPFVVRHSPEQLALIQKYHDELVDRLNASGYPCSKPIFTLAS